LDVTPQLPCIADVHGISLPAFDGGREVHATYGRLDHLLDVFHGEAVPSGLLPLHGDVEKIARGDALGVDAPRAGDRFHVALDLEPYLFDLIQVRTEDLDAHRGPDAGGEHVQPRLYGHGKGIRDAGDGEGI